MVLLHLRRPLRTSRIECAGATPCTIAAVERALLAALLLCSACDLSTAAIELVPEPAPEVAWPLLTCDALVPSYCAFPYPSNVYTVADDASLTGLRVVIDDATLPQASNGTTFSLDGQWQSDGFSSGGPILAQMPGAIDVGLISPYALDDYLASDVRTVLIDTETGEHIPHFSELDKSRLDQPEAQAIMIRPVVRLADGRRYIVALRRIESGSGVLPPSPAFRALRDRLPFREDPSIDARRALYADIFQRLEAIGWQRGEVQLAWDFTTASRDNNTRYLIHMRDEALAAAGDAGPAYTITDVQNDVDSQVLLRIEGTFEAPLYLTDPGPGGRLLLGDDGLPEPNPEQPTVDVPFLMLIPRSAETKPVALLQYGHGLLGSKGQLEAGNFRELIETKGYAIFGVTFDGMAEDDSLWIGERLASADIAGLTAMFDRQHQGMLQQLLAMRMVSRGLVNDPSYGRYLDASLRAYHGISQGGIFGAGYMALSTDVSRGVLGVAGMSYGLLLKRSVDFGPFFALMALSFRDARDQLFLLALVQSFWDRTEPNGYAASIETDTLPGTPPHEVLIRLAVGDHQVSNLGGHVMARAIGATHVDTGVRTVFGFDAVASTESGSSLVEYDFGLPPDPVCNIPMSACDDPHGLLRKLPAAAEQLDTFLRTGKTINACPDGRCRFPELAGCGPDDQTPRCGE